MHRYEGPSGHNTIERNRVMKRKGFTLIELMIVVVIIGILAAIAIPKFNDVAESSKRNACRSNMRTIASQEVIYFAGNNEYTSSLLDLNLDGVVCPGTKAAHTIAISSIGGGTNNSFTITCTNTPSHGNIDNGITSWTDHT